MGKKASLKIDVSFHEDDIDYDYDDDFDWNLEGSTSARSKSKNSQSQIKLVTLRSLGSTTTASSTIKVATRAGLCAIPRCYTRRQKGFQPFASLDQNIVVVMAHFLDLTSIQAWSCTCRLFNDILASDFLYCRCASRVPSSSRQENATGIMSMEEEYDNMKRKWLARQSILPCLLPYEVEILPRLKDSAHKELMQELKQRPLGVARKFASEATIYSRLSGTQNSKGEVNFKQLFTVPCPRDCTADKALDLSLSYGGRWVRYATQSGGTIISSMIKDLGSSKKASANSVTRCSPFPSCDHLLACAFDTRQEVCAMLSTPVQGNRSRSIISLVSLPGLFHASRKDVRRPQWQVYIDHGHRWARQAVFKSSSSTSPPPRVSFHRSEDTHETFVSVLHANRCVLLNASSGSILWETNGTFDACCLHLGRLFLAFSSEAKKLHIYHLPDLCGMRKSKADEGEASESTSLWNATPIAVVKLAAPISGHHNFYPAPSGSINQQSTEISQIFVFGGHIWVSTWSQILCTQRIMRKVFQLADFVDRRDEEGNVLSPERRENRAKKNQIAICMHSIRERASGPSTCSLPLLMQQHGDFLYTVHRRSIYCYSRWRQSANSIPCTDVPASCHTFRMASDIEHIQMDNTKIICLTNDGTKKRVEILPIDPYASIFARVQYQRLPIIVKCASCFADKFDVHRIHVRGNRLAVLYENCSGTMSREIRIFDINKVIS
jgi:hypothetical protein